MFNTFPTQSSSESTSTTTSIGDLGPVLKHSSLPAYRQSGNQRNLEGFASLSRSSIVLPNGVSGSLVLVDSTGSTIWSYAPGAFNARPMSLISAISVCPCNPLLGIRSRFH